MSGLTMAWMTSCPCGISQVWRNTGQPNGNIVWELDGRESSAKELEETLCLFLRKALEKCAEGQVAATDMDGLLTSGKDNQETMNFCEGEA